MSWSFSSATRLPTFFSSPSLTDARELESVEEGREREIGEEGRPLAEPARAPAWALEDVERAELDEGGDVFEREATGDEHLALVAIAAADEGGEEGVNVDEPGEV